MASPPLSSSEIRRSFIDFYAKKHAHAFVPSNAVVPHDDPTLLFTNAGMNQFKPIFLGQADPATPMGKLKRAVNSQKCIRAGGKHNDLDDVGKDTYHHTFFEMLGTWSFGDYFKAESIDWGWEFLTKVMGIPGDRFYVTYFAGNPSAGLEPDLEAREIWKKHLPPGRILPGSMKDNFWEMGDTGPCGPCSEIHFDRIGGRDAATLVNSGDPDVLEVWNHVFIQFNREEGGKLKPLPAKHVDTGMGFERLVSVIQNVRSNYDSDVFAPLFVAIEQVTGTRKPYTGKLGAADRDNTDTAYRVIADHIRTLTFAITDGAVPSNEGRGYVLRRILRRAVRYGRQTLGARTGFFSLLVPRVVEQMGEFFPELRKDPARVQEIIREEEESFGRTLERGIILFDEACLRAYSKARLSPHLQAAGATASVRKTDQGHAVLEIAVPKNAMLTGSFRAAEMTPAWADTYYGPTRGLAAEDAFKLYDTYGFPVDLTVLMAEERGLRVDTPGFEKLMEEAKEKARAGGAGRFAAATAALELPPEAIARLRHMEIAPTDDVDKFHGRDVRARVMAIWGGDSFTDSIDASLAMKPVAVILDKTNFYAEMGGQLGDEGTITVMSARPRGDNDDTTGTSEFRVDDTKAYGGYVTHIGHVLKNELRVGDEVQLSLDSGRRGAIASNHTATHLLNLALARTLGPDVNQKGSLVAEDRLRFDFSHGKPVASEELVKIEDEVRGHIAKDLAVFAEPVPLAAGKQVPGLRAVFGETYPDPVRLVSIGTPVADALAGTINQTGLERSAEFCGGTHVGSTGAIGHFVLLAEEAVAKGVRRLTGLSGISALAATKAGEGLLAHVLAAQTLEGDALTKEIAAISQELEAIPVSVVVKHRARAAIAGMQERLKAASKQAAAGRAAEVVSRAKVLAESMEFDQGAFIVTTIEADSDREALAAAMSTIRQRRARQAVMLISPDAEGGKINIVAQVPDLLIKRGLNAGEWVRVAATACGGKGGGKPDAAQGGGTDVTKLKDVLAAANAHAFGKCPN